MKKTVKINEAKIRQIVESTLRNLLKEDVNEEGHPSVYVGTYGKYNNGSLEGEWVDLTKFNNKQEFLRYCNKLHSNEPEGQREFMFQDWEYIPDLFIGESWISDKFWDFMNDDSYPYDVKYAVAEHASDVDEYFKDIENIAIYPGCNNMADVAEYAVREYGLLQNPEYYFDYQQYGREMSWDGRFDGEEGSIYDEFGVEEGDDQSLGEAIADTYGGVEQLGKETIERYFDYEALGRALDTEATFIPYDNGYIELY